MCSNLDNRDDYHDLNAGPGIKIDKKDFRKCRKCDSSSFVLLQKKDPLCRSCFDEYSSHKYRSTVAKHKLIRNGTKVLIAFSGGASSSALLNLVQECVQHPEEHRRAIYVPHVVHIDESILLPANCDSHLSQIRAAMKKTSWNAYVSSIESSFCCATEKSYGSLSDETAYESSDAIKGQFTAALNDMKSLTSKEEFLRRLRNQLLVDIAKKECLDAIFLGTNGSRLSIQLIADVAQGKGNQIHLETGFCDDRFDIPIFKPLREFVSKEIQFYNRSKEVPFVENIDLLSKQSTKSSISKLTEAFINDLQTGFPATVYTLYKISSKVKPYQLTEEKCSLCGANNDKKETRECSAQTALSLSETLSRNNDQLDEVENGQIRQSLCYGCSRIFNEMSKQSFPKHIVHRATKDSIKDFLL
ncbi:Cytoplasmic tRNA 2-thiolation protein 2-A [Halotydeus destructor]|nr:Cytoplasmic tRNA 2-thiolation protein 2-A [Halotydeus destructor]